MHDDIISEPQFIGTALSFLSKPPPPLGFETRIKGYIQSEVKANAETQLIVGRYRFPFLSGSLKLLIDLGFFFFYGLLPLENLLRSFTMAIESIFIF